MTSQKATPVTIQVNGLNMSGAELTLSYDPRSIVISQVSDGGLLSKDGQLLAVVQVIDPDTGKAHISIERPPNASPITGSGNLLTLIAGTPLSYSMLSIVLAFASCSPIGVGFAFMPARAASRLDPLAALARH